QEILGYLLILRVAHKHVGERAGKVELAAGAFGERRMLDVLPHRRPLVGLVGVGLAFGLEIDRGAVVGGAYAARQKRAVIARIVPGEPSLVERLLPKRHREFNRFDGFLAVERDSLAVSLDLLAAP